MQLFSTEFTALLGVLSLFALTTGELTLSGSGGLICVMIADISSALWCLLEKRQLSRTQGYVLNAVVTSAISSALFFGFGLMNVSAWSLIALIGSSFVACAAQFAIVRIAERWDEEEINEVLKEVREDKRLG